MESETIYDIVSNMEENKTRLDKLKDYSAELEADIFATQEQLLNETDKAHVTFLNDHLNILKFELDKANADIYILRRKLKKFQLN